MAAAVWAFQWWHGDERRLRSRLGELADLISKDEGENQLTAANQARRLGLLLAEPFEIRLEPFGQVVRDRQQLQQAFFAYRSGFARIAADLAVEDLEIRRRDPAGRDGGRRQPGRRSLGRRSGPRPLSVAAGLGRERR
ncbi:MAG: hypothetical protein HC897_17430 [Thermoanaerobaculia bacterium]|nr:hypothetical protein [Thermoanaerobaculia bacterium]